jgi:hypothetical protein
MALTLPELKARLATKDVSDLLDILRLDSEQLVELASDLIEARYDELVEEVVDIEEFQPEEWHEPMYLSEK